MRFAKLQGVYVENVLDFYYGVLQCMWSLELRLYRVINPFVCPRVYLYPFLDKKGGMEGKTTGLG